ncbi:unnamed protein product [Lymnaea stagnalis]|uniref:ZSWIM3 N-terminal domain-containing protein n=1 Tax=Lymnaea stagnalis TaxID=6523 RepID=A0AAV2H3F4_LYMST
MVRKHLLNIKPEVINTDTSAEFLRVFRSLRPEFNSWDEFSTLLEEFQKVTGAAFKPKCGTSVVNINRRRVYNKIPECFKYQTVNMVCQHYGVPTTTTPRRNSYMGLNCKAHIKLSYSKGRLHVTSVIFTHSNHPLIPSGNNPKRQLRTVTFNDYLDLLMVREVLASNVYLYKNGDKHWKATVIRIQDLDPGFLHVTQRMVKRRTQFLIDNYLENSIDSSPSPNDEMGQILKKLSELREPKPTAKPRLPRTPTTLPKALPKDLLKKKKSKPKKKPKRGRGRPRKKTLFTEDESQYLVKLGSPEVESNEDIDYFSTLMDVPDINTDYKTTEISGEMDSLEPAISFSPASHVKGNSTDNRPTPDNCATPDNHPTPDNSVATDHCVPPPGLTNVDLFWEYWRHRDAEERRLRQKEIRIRQEEIQLRKQELALQKQKFEFDRDERESYRRLLFKQWGSYNKSSEKPGVNSQLDNNDPNEYAVILSTGDILSMPV